MITSFGIATCIIAIAGSVKVTAFEYSKLCKDRQLCHALRLAVNAAKRTERLPRENISVGQLSQTRGPRGPRALRSTGLECGAD
jgi:hypothetical protein